jgi:hypothetical protein
MGGIFLIMGKGKLEPPRQKLTIFLSGLFNAFMAIILVYSCNPQRTPIIIQSILSGLVILPSVILSKLVLDKQVVYDKRYIIPSLILLGVALAIPVIDMGIDGHWRIQNIYWSLLYLVGVICRSVFSVLQEKYFIQTADPSMLNKISLTFYTRLVQFGVVIACFWLEYVVGSTTHPLSAFGQSFLEMVDSMKGALFLQGFVVAYLVNYILCIFLNSISTNYNMIITTAVTPALAVFFLIFPKLNNGEQVHTAFVVPSLICCVASAILWIKGETKTDYKAISDKDTKDTSINV